MTRVALTILLLLVVLPRSAVAQASEDSTWQTWNDVTVELGLSERAAVELLGELRAGLQPATVRSTRAGVALPLPLGDHFTVAPSYLYVAESGEGITHNHRVRIDGTLELPVAGLTLENRNRVERRWMDAEPDTWHVRPRLRLSGAVTAGVVELRPFGSAEFFHDSADGWFRNRYAGGVEFDVGQDAALELHYTFQHARRDGDGHVHEVGTSWTFRPR